MKLLTIFLLTLLSGSTFGQEFNEIEINSGVLYSTVTSQRPANEGLNRFRFGIFVSAESNLQLRTIKSYTLNLGFDISYQERMPLEFFTFEAGATIGIPTFHLIKDFPSNPQHEFFEISGFDKFPNFKYLHFGVMPSISFGHKFKTNIGFGIFGGILINKEATTRRPSNFANLEYYLTQTVTSNVEYSRFDFGWQSKLSCSYAISKKINLGFMLRSSRSLVRMNQTAVNEERVHNWFWLTYLGGVSLQYKFSQKEN